MDARLLAEWVVLGGRLREASPKAFREFLDFMTGTLALSAQERDARPEWWEFRGVPTLH